MSGQSSLKIMQHIKRNITIVVLVLGAICVDVALGCNTGCISCSYSIFCTNCDTKYYLSSGACYPCRSNCAICADYGNCYTCESGYYGPSCDNDCSLCQDGSCTKGGCTQGCKDGYYDATNGAGCKTCLPNCISCTDNTNCDKCVAGKWGTMCKDSCNPYHCKDNICSQDNAECTNGCTDGYYSSSTSCYGCPDNCETCTSKTICGPCKDGTWGAICDSQCPDSCTTCNKTGACDSDCADGYYMYTTANVCTPCSEGCSTCSSQSVCIYCMHGYVLLGHACVIQCPVGCSICSSPNQCTACINGYVLSENACSQCPVGCLTCSSSNVCTSCTTRYKLLGDVCVIQCPAGCTKCSSTNVCTACSSDYVLSEKLCYPQCPVGCESCLSPTVCSSCINGYVLHTLSNSCVIQCKEGCSKCSSATVCTSCRTGYMLSNSTCVLCPPGWTCNRQDSEMHLVDAEDNSNNVIYGSIGGVLCGIIITLLVVAAIYYFRKRRNRLRENDRNPETPGIPIADLTSTSTEQSLEYERLDNDRIDVSTRGNHQRGRLPESLDNAADYSSTSKYEDLVDKNVTENQYNVIVQHPYENI